MGGVPSFLCNVRCRAARQLLLLRRAHSLEVGTTHASDFQMSRLYCAGEEQSEGRQLGQCVWVVRTVLHQNLPQATKGARGTVDVHTVPLYAASPPPPALHSPAAPRTSAMVRSEEKKPEPAVDMMDMRVHLAWSRYTASTRSCRGTRKSQGRGSAQVGLQGEAQQEAQASYSGRGAHAVQDMQQGGSPPGGILPTSCLRVLHLSRTWVVM